MRNTGNEILKKTLLHYINLEYYANSLDEEFQTLLEELQERCNKAIESQKTISTKASYTAIYRIIKEEVDKFQKEFEERLEEQAELIMNQETEFLDGLYNEPTEKNTEEKGESTNSVALTFSGVTLSKVLFSPIDGRDTAKQFAERTGKNILRSYDTPLRAGYLFGQKSEEVTAQVSSQMKQVARGMQSGILTAIPSFAKTTDRIVFLNNNVEVVWCAVLDGRGCITCYSLNGLHFKSASLAPAIPHNRCRCVLCPAKDITEPLPTYEEYIESLSEDEQLHILGRNRYELWKNYDIELKQFVNNGTVLPVEKLKENLASLQKISNGTSKKLITATKEEVRKFLSDAINTTDDYRISLGNVSDSARERIKDKTGFEVNRIVLDSSEIRHAMKKTEHHIVLSDLENIDSIINTTTIIKLEEKKHQNNSVIRFIEEKENGINLLMEYRSKKGDLSLVTAYRVKKEKGQTH